MTSATIPPALRFSVALEPSHLLRARERLRDYLRLHCADDELVEDVILCLEEACTNAIRHSGAEEEMQISLRFEGDDLTAVVADKGKGFDIEAVDPRAEPDSTSYGGRGLYIIAKLMDDLTLRFDGGLEVRMVKRAMPRCAPPILGAGPHEAGAAGTGPLVMRVRALIEELDEGFAALDWEYRFVHANQAAQRLVGAASEEAILGQTPFELWPQIAGSELEVHYREAMELGRSSIFERLSTITGDWIEMRFYPTTSGISLYLREINERKHKEEERDRLLEDLRTQSERLERQGGELKTRIRRDEMLEDVGRLMYSTLVVNEIVRKGFDSAIEALGADAGSVEMRDGESWSSRHRRGIATQELGPRLSEAEGALATRAADLGEPLAFDDLAEGEEADVGLLRDRGIRSTLVLPLRAEGAVLGCLLFHSQRPAAFGGAELEFARKLGALLSVSLANTRLAERERETRGLTALRWSRTAAVVARLRAHPWGVVFGAIAVQAAFLSVVAVVGETRRVLGVPGSVIALVAVIVGAVAGPLAGALSAAAAGVIFYFSVAGRGDHTSLAATLTATAIWLIAGVLSGVLSDRLSEESGRRRGAAVALARGEAAREAQLAEQRRVEALAEQLQYRNEALAVQGEALRAKTADLAERAALTEALNSVNELVHSTLDFDDIMLRALTRGVEALGADAGAIELREADAWVVAYQHGFSERDVGTRLSDAEAASAVRAVESPEPFTTVDMASDPSLDVGFVHAHGLRSVLGTALVGKGASVGCLLIYGKAPREHTAAEVDFCRKLGATVSLALENSRLLRDEREAARLSRALNEINNLIHATLDAPAIMQRVVAESAEAVGAGSVMVALKHGDDWVAEYGHPEMPGVVNESVRTGEAPFMVTAIDERRPVAIDDCATDERCYPEVQARFGVRSVLCIPLIVRDEVLGVVFFNHHEAPKVFEPRTIEFADQLATAMSSALENARLFAAQQRIATTLQENLIHPTAAVPGLELGTVTQTAYEPDLVGGDFSDVFELEDGRAAVLIGDVAGKGIKAAGLTETVRSTVRAVAAIDPSPAFVLGKTNEVLLRHDPSEPHVTAFLVVVDPRTGQAVYASAGHPAPVRVSAASAAPLVVEYGPPLRSFLVEYREARVELDARDYLLFYTDGVIEARRGGEEFGDLRLVELAGSLWSRSAKDVAEAVRAATLEFADTLRDDLHVVCVRLA